MKYQDGQPVCLGDVVRYADVEAFVEEVILQGTEAAQNYGCTTDAVMIFLPSNRDRFLLRPEEDEDLILVARGSAPVPSEAKTGSAIRVPGCTWNFWLPALALVPWFK